MFSFLKLNITTVGFFLFPFHKTHTEFVLMSSAWQVVTSSTTLCAMLRFYSDIRSFFNYYFWIITNRRKLSRKYQRLYFLGARWQAWTASDVLEKFLCHWVKLSEYDCHKPQIIGCWWLKFINIFHTTGIFFFFLRRKNKNC